VAVVDSLYGCHVGRCSLTGVNQMYTKFRKINYSITCWARMKKLISMTGLEARDVVDINNI
jgi:hypothetical protein